MAGAAVRVAAGVGAAAGAVPAGAVDVAGAVAAAAVAVTVTVAAGRAAAGAGEDEQPVSAARPATAMPAVLARAMRFMSGSLSVPQSARAPAVSQGRGGR